MNNFIHKPFTDPTYTIYDLETYPNIFTAAFKNIANGVKRMYEISTRRNDLSALLDYLYWCEANLQKHVGFNNFGFDYPIIHIIMELGISCTLDDIYGKAQEIINTDWSNRFKNVIWQPKINQVDLFKIHHFDNSARSTSLKTLEINMRMDSVQDLPFPPGTILTNSQMDILCEYNWHDIDATEWFFHETIPAIKLRKELSQQYNIDMTNFSDSKIGASIFTHELTKAELPTDSKTPRNSIDLSECILDYIQFEQPEFNRILNHLKSKIITETKGVFNELSCIVGGIEYIFGTGGLHAANASQTFISDDKFMIKDSDVKSYYPNLSIKNKFYPEHLGEEFCDIYEKMYIKRSSFKKGTPENAALKIALNASFGNSNNKYSNLYDPMFTMKITLNGQLLLCMLCEQLIKVPELTIIAVNTDGVCYHFPRKYEQHVIEICEWWETMSKGLELEHVNYDKFFLLDVNNYLSVES